MSPRNVQRKKPLKNTEIIELVNLPDGDESEDDLNNFESEEEGVQTSVINLSAASTSSSISVKQNPSTSNLNQNISSRAFVDIDSIFDNNDDWSSNDEEPLETYRRIRTTQRQDIHYDAELCVSDDDSVEQENDSDCEETE